ncbi:MAG TPA: NADH-quinone oxidoreductase subunit J [bacterium]|nr:NADH-quinone oxidoreductase subunit J [bacterium]
MIESVLFYFLAAVLVGTALLVVTRTNPIASAIAMVAAFAALSGLYAMLSASLAAILQVLVYAGGIMVLVIFVIMLLNLRKEELEPMKARAGSFLAALAALLVLVVGPIWMGLAPSWKPMMASLEPGFGSISAVGAKLFSEYLFPFEMLSFVLLTAIVGALVLSKRKL